MVKENITIRKVSYVIGLGHNLFSIGKFCDKGLEVNFKVKRYAVRTDEGKELLLGSRKRNLNTIDLLTEASNQQDFLWHRRLSHLIFRNLNKLVIGNLAKDIPELKIHKEHLCVACEVGKMKRASHM